MNPDAHARWYPYTTSAISSLSWDPVSLTHIPFRATTNHTHSNWAQIYFSKPELYLRPQSTQEIQLIVKLASKCRKRIVVVGSRHTPNDLTCTDSWMINLDDFTDVVRIDEAQSEITVQAGLRLYSFHKILEGLGWAMPSLGSISEQSLAGATGTATHGASLKHGLLSDDITALTIVLASGEEVSCSRTIQRDLFLAALVSLGALGVITSITFHAVPSFNLLWQQEVHSHSELLAQWNTIWSKSEYERVWWYPYSKKCLLWHADKTDEPLRNIPPTWFGTKLGFHLNQILLYISVLYPPFTKFAETYMFKKQYGHIDASGRTSGVQTSVEGMSMDCLYRQFVNEWSIPLKSGDEALRRLQAWLDNEPESVHKIPFNPTGVYAHSPVEVRPSYPSEDARKHRPLLDTHQPDEPSLYINATLFRPYGRDIPSREKYYEAFEWLMKSYGGKTHWAKNFITVEKEDFLEMYGDRLEKWKEVRARVDNEGVFLNDFVKRNLVGDGDKTPIGGHDGSYSPSSSHSFDEMKASVMSYEEVGREEAEGA